MGNIPLNHDAASPEQISAEAIEADADSLYETVMGSATPSDLNIQSRNRHFSSAAIDRRYWVGGDPYATAFFNALSITFPKGETFFIKVLQQYRDDAPEKLRREISGFVRQEAVHSREHLFFNKQLEQSGYDTSRLDKTLTDVLDRIGQMSQTEQLVATTCLEHLTAIMAAEYIANPRHLRDADAEQRKMWLWHASEEIEHKGVAYDTWLHATRDWSRTKRWLTKSVFMTRISLSFAKNRFKGALDLLRQDGVSDLRARLGILRYAFVKPGLLRHVFWPWMQFFLPGFHPWNKDDRHLIQLAESEYEAAIMDQPKVAETVAVMDKHQNSVPVIKVA
ncbi:metal-dependent hydrolase [Parasphingorhabdus sp. JC815]|uniref:metal-dependent hydrolase n=1 Tax=Parasphingorhabdus sp. JC815 TaxID=3232140 RepID=UPI0034592931